MHGSLLRLKKMAGTTGALELLDRFLNESPQRLADALEAVRRNDVRSAQLHVHRVRSDAGWLGAKTVQDLAGRAEMLLVEGPLDGIEQLLEELSGECYEASQELERQRTILLGSKEL